MQKFSEALSWSWQWTEFYGSSFETKKQASWCQNFKGTSKCILSLLAFYFSRLLPHITAISMQSLHCCVAWGDCCDIVMHLRAGRIKTIKVTWGHVQVLPAHIKPTSLPTSQREQLCWFDTKHGSLPKLKCKRKFYCIWSMDLKYMLSLRVRQLCLK